MASAVFSGDGASAEGTLSRGVFSTTSDAKIGFGATRKTIQKQVMVYAEEQADGSFTIQALNDNHVPSGETVTIEREALLTEYLPEPQLWHEKVWPAMRTLAKHIARGERHREMGEGYSAEFEFKNALAIDEANVRATFGLGLTYLDRNDLTKAREVFNRLISLPGAFGREHKHMFNEFGIKLRRCGMLDEALRFYAIAFKISNNDDHLLYNIARTLFDKGDYARCLSYLEHTLKLNPKLEEAQQLLRAAAQKIAQSVGG